jgi:hypothetical protein
MSTGDLPPWPEYRDFAMKFGPTNLASEAYNNALANASIARLRKAVEALREIHTHRYAEDMDLVAREALALIGDIPER